MSLLKSDPLSLLSALVLSSTSESSSSCKYDSIDRLSTTYPIYWVASFKDRIYVKSRYDIDVSDTVYRVPV